MKVQIIIPLVARSVAKDWGFTCQCLAATLQSVLALPEDFAAVTVVGHDVPERVDFGSRCNWLEVPFSPPDADDTSGKLNDKGMKVMHGTQFVYEHFDSEWVMFVDADDSLSAKLPKFCDLKNYDAIAFGRGYLWVPGSQSIRSVTEFHRLCGTSWIMRLKPEMFPVWLGSGSGDYRVCDQGHDGRLAAVLGMGARLQLVSQPLAIYSIQHQGNTGHGRFVSRSGTGVKRWLRDRFQSLQLVPLSGAIRQEFGLPSDPKFLK